MAFGRRLHPGSRRCLRSPYSKVRLAQAPCQPGASVPSVRHRIYESDHLEDTGIGVLRGVLTEAEVDQGDNQTDFRLMPVQA